MGPRLGACVLALAGALGCAAPAAPPTPVYPGEPPLLAEGEVGIWGVVRRADDLTPIEGALVVVQSRELLGERELQTELQTDAEGAFVFEHLPAGTLTIMVLYGQADPSKAITIAAGRRFAEFQIDPDTPRPPCLVGVPPPLSDSLFSIRDDNEARLLGVPRTIYR